VEILHISKADTSLDWYGKYKSTRDSQASLFPALIPAFVLIVFIIAVLFNESRPPAIRVVGEDVHDGNLALGRSVEVESPTRIVALSLQVRVLREQANPGSNPVGDATSPYENNRSHRAPEDL
jgi:hypothetical protein